TRKKTKHERNKNRHRSVELTLDYSPRSHGQPVPALHCAATGFLFPITGSGSRRCHQSDHLHLRQAGMATFFRSSSSSRTRRAPRATQDIGSWATVTASWVSAPISRSEEATTAGDDDARIDDIRSQFRGGLLEP